MNDRIKSEDSNVNYHITLMERGRERSFECAKEESLLSAMVREGVYVSAACGGRGTCGKCKVQVITGTTLITSFDTKTFTQEELDSGYRLACKAIPVTDLTIKLTGTDESEFEVVADQGIRISNQRRKEDRYVIAIDIGTTTIAISLVELLSKAILHTYTTVNRQRVYGADVIARMEASNQGKQKELKESIQRDLLSGIRAVVDQTGIQEEQITKVAIAGNTTMGHLLLGYSCKTLGSYPFTPVDISTTVRSFKDVLNSDYLKVPVTILPGISTFVGADIAAGLLSCNYDRSNYINLFIDLGTNGEMAIGNRDRILVSSTAAGPAFEGGNISCGVGSVAGAICSIELGDKLTYRTIGDKAPVGICGTGVIEITRELLMSGLVDGTGLLIDEYFEKGYKIATDPEGKDIIFTQRDIREIQLAKAAVRAGLEILIRRYGISYEDIHQVFLAGGFGYKMDVNKAIDIGLLPKELTGKILAIGNSSLHGTISYLTEEEAQGRIEQIIALSEEISLSNDEDFNELYVEAMYL